MQADELWEKLDGRNGIADLRETPAGILITLKTDSLLTLTSDDVIERVCQKGTSLEIVVREGREAFVQDLLKKWNDRGPLNLKRILSGVMDALSGSLVPLLPMLMAAAMFKTVVSILGPDMLHVISAESDLHTLLTFVADAGFYFFPVAVGYTSAAVFHATPMLGVFLGAILIHPTFIHLAETGAKFTVYGIPAPALNYSSTILPVILSVWVLSWVEKGMRKIVPDVLKDVFVPFLSTAVVLPIMFCVMAPAGSYLGSALCSGMIRLGSQGGVVTVLTIAVLGALWEFIIMGGLHWLFISSIYVILAANGQETIITPMCAAAAFATGGMAVGAALREKDRRERSSDISYALAQMIGGVTEPALYGVGFRYRKPFIGLVTGAFFGSLYAGLTHLTAYNFIPSASFLCFLNYAGGTAMNFWNGVISAVIAFFVSAGVTWLVCNKE